MVSIPYDTKRPTPYRNTFLPIRWWLELAQKPSPRSFSLWRRVWGPIKDRRGSRLSFVSRLFYEWFVTDDPYYVRVDEELREKGI